MSPSADAVLELFRSRFGGTADGVWVAPGRANLMGEHTDYNEGFVLPFALGQGIAAAASRRSDRRLVVYSVQEPDAVVDVVLGDLAPGQVTGWAAYPAGVAWSLAAAGYEVPGACLAIDSDVPAGAGLSSSAALECATALALTELAGAGLAGDRRELAAIASLETSQVPFDPAASGAQLLLINTRARHQLTAGAYAERRAECEQAARLLGVPSLRYLTAVADTSRLTDPVLRRRARHVVTDDQRVLEVVALLRSGSADAYPQIGRLLTQAHVSLRDDFEVSWPEADVTVDAALAAGALGARMIGGGFGGSVLALVGSAAEVRAAVAEAFARRSWTAPQFLSAVPSDSARRVALG